MFNKPNGLIERAAARVVFPIRTGVVARAVVPVALLVPASLALGRGPAREADASPSARWSGPVVFTQIPVDAPAEGDQCVDLPAGSRIVLFDPSAPADRTTNLTEGFAAAGRPDLSFDGKRVLFVGQRAPSDPCAAWEITLDAHPDPSVPAARHVAGLGGGLRSAVYLATIYTIDAQRPVYQIALSGRARRATSESIYTLPVGALRPARITFTPDGVFDPYVLSDGRLLFANRKPRALGSVLYTVNTDGTDVFVFAAAHEPPACRAMPCETIDGHVVYVESNPTRQPHTRCGWDHGGTLVSVARTRSLHTRRVVADDTAGVYHSPSALGNGHLLVSWRPRGIASNRATRDPGAVAGDTPRSAPAAPVGGGASNAARNRDGSYGLYELDPATGRRLRCVFDAPDWHDVHAVAIEPRREPAGRSSVVDHRATTGLLYCLDAYRVGTERADDTGDRRIDRVRVIRARNTAPQPEDTTSRRSVRSAVSQKRDPAAPALASARAGEPAAPDGVIAQAVLGDVPVERDGSFYVEVPARTPLRLQTLNAAGQILTDMRSWIWVMPRETRGCIGCHEDRELTPPNRLVRALTAPPYRFDDAQRAADRTTGPDRRRGYPK